MSRLYSYVGPSAIREAARSAKAGSTIEERAELKRWIDMHADDEGADGSITATFVVDREGKLRLSPRRSEHIACASGGPVLCAGEISFARNGEVVEVSNYSTGYCPEPDSWQECARALDRIGVQHPGQFTRKVVFRRCSRCYERNLVKDQWYVCELCGEALPDKWNF